MIKLASSLLTLTTVRAGVVVPAKWDEFGGIDSERHEVPAVDPMRRIAAARMKLSVEDNSNDGFGHAVPLAPQAIAVLRALRLFPGFRDLVFPSDKRWREPMSDATISTMYKRLRGGNYRKRMKPHGWRAAFSTIINKRAAEFAHDGDRLIIDMVVAHVPPGISVSEWAYNGTRYRKYRTDLLLTWADVPSAELKEAMSLIGFHDGC